MDLETKKRNIKSILKCERGALTEEEYEDYGNNCCPCVLQDFLDGIDEDIDWEVDEGAKSVADAISPVLDEELKELLQRSCDDDEHNEWLYLLRAHLSI